MATLEINVKENGRPLRRTYVEHVVIGFGNNTMYLTDDTGRVRSEGGDPGVTSGTDNADIRVLCQNSVVKVLDGGTIPVPLAVNQDFAIVGNATADLNTDALQNDHYEILSRCLLAYDVVFRQFQPFSDNDRQEFPLKQEVTLRETKDQARRIEISFPSNFPVGDAAFVEAKSIATGFPLVHFRPRAQDRRLFGDQGRAPTLIPGELAHALHFSLFTEAERETIQNDYIGWIASDGAAGGDMRHEMGKPTTPMVAYLEAFDHFAGRFAEFVRVRVQGAVYSGSQTVVAMLAYQTGVITAFSGKGIYFSPDGQNLGGGGDTTRVYSGNRTVVAMIAYQTGVITAFSSGGIYFSPDGQNLGGGGGTTGVYSGSQKVAAMIAYGTGVITAFSSGGIYFSPDGQNLGGGGGTIRVYSGSQAVTAMIAYGSGVITAFSSGGIYFSPDGQNLGGGGSTISVYSGSQAVAAMIAYRTGVITAFSSGGIYFSPDGQNLGGSGSTNRVYSGRQTVVTMIAYQRAVITAFSSGGIYFSLDGQNLGGGGNTIRVDSASQPVTTMVPYQAGVITAFSSGGGVCFSPDGQNLGGAGRTMLRPQEITDQIRQDFVTSELSGSPVTVTDVNVATLDGGTIVPNSTFNGSDDEGSVYGCIFVDFASRVGLRTAVNAYLESASEGARTFGEYKTFIAETRPQNLEDLEEAQVTWSL